MKPTGDAIGSIAVFNDTIRDGLKGSVFDSKDQGYANGNSIKANANKVIFGIQGGQRIRGASWYVDDAMVIFNLDFAPVADVRTQVKREEIGTRAFSYDANEAARMVTAFIRGLHAHGILSVAKHFPGHGAVSGNTHTGQGVSVRTLEE